MNSKELYGSLLRISETICARRLRLAAQGGIALYVSLAIVQAAMKRLLQKFCFGNPNRVTQIEGDLELHTLILSRLILDWTIPKR